MKISIIIPVYNAAKYLDVCITSILDQSYLNLEVLVINDGSKDDSGNICDGYAAKDDRVKVFHKPNGGVSKARNLGLDHATGDWITFVDSDDYIEKDLVKCFVDNLEIGSDLYLQGVIIHKGNLRKAHYRYQDILTKNLDDFLTQFNIHPHLASPWGKLFNRNIIEINNIRFDQSVSYGEDTLFNLEYISYCRKVTLLKSENYNYIHKDTGLSKVQLRYSHELNIYNKVKNKMEKISKNLNHYSFLACRVMESIYIDNAVVNKKKALSLFLAENKEESKNVYVNAKGLGKIIFWLIEYKKYSMLNIIFTKIYKE